MNSNTPSYALASPGSNRLLDALSPPIRAEILALVEEIETPTPMSIYEEEGRIDYAYFPISGIISTTTVLENGAMIETGLTGADGFVGIPLMLGSHHSQQRVFVQVSGRALRIRVKDFQEAYQKHPALHALLMRYAYAVHSQTAQSVACNRSHEAEERLCRWLLMVQDRLASDELPLTHEFLGLMLGTRRATVTIAAGLLQRAGVLRYTRGHIHILNRGMLEEAACECYPRGREYVNAVFAPIG